MLFVFWLGKGELCKAGKCVVFVWKKTKLWALSLERGTRRFASSLSLFFFFLNLISLAKGLSFLFIFSKRGLRCHRKLSTSQLLLVAVFIHLHPRKYKLCANAFGVQQNYRNRHVLQTLTQRWPQPLTVCALWQNTTKSTPQGQPVPTRSSREIHGLAQLIMLIAKEFILAYCGLIRWVSFFLSHRGTLMVFLLTCDLLTTIRI